MPKEKIVVYINWGANVLSIPHIDGRVLLLRGYKETKIASNGFVIVKNFDERG